jgi:hypothetical protein
VNTPFATAAINVEIIATQAASDAMKDYPSEAWPTETYINDRNELFFDGEAIEIYHPARAHTDGDSIVFFRRSDVIATGGIMDTDRYPIIDLAMAPPPAPGPRTCSSRPPIGAWFARPAGRLPFAAF